MNINIYGEVDLTELKYVPIQKYDPLLEGDVLFNNTNSPIMLGKATTINMDTNWAYSNHMTRLRFNIKFVNPKWISYSLNNLFYQGFFKMNCTNHVNQASINSTFLAQKVLIPFPTLEEQNILVNLIEKSLSTVSNIEKEIEVRLKHINILRKSILKHAFEGKLVPQNPNDEPASILLKKIMQDKPNEEIKNNNKSQYKQTKLI